MAGAFLDPRVFAEAAGDETTRAYNEGLIAAARVAPDRWTRAPADLREDRRRGIGPFPRQRPSARAETIEVPRAGGTMPLRVIRPAGGGARGAYLHVHGGGWMLGAADLQDERLEETAERTGLACVSVEYRLSPEHPYPAAPDDCEAAALWLAREGAGNFGGGPLFIGGESAGAHLSVVALLRLRDRHALTPFSGANLVCGIYDLRLTPSMRAFTEPLVLARRDTENFVARFLQGNEDRTAPDVSPLFADLRDMPPALFSCGTRDGLLDDTLFMAARWAAAGHHAELSLWPGGAHAFQSMGLPLGDASNAHMDRWMKARAEAA